MNNLITTPEGTFSSFSLFVCAYAFLLDFHFVSLIYKFDIQLIAHLVSQYLHVFRLFPNRVTHHLSDFCFICFYLLHFHTLELISVTLFVIDCLSVKLKLILLNCSFFYTLLTTIVYSVK